MSVFCKIQLQQPCRVLYPLPSPQVRTACRCAIAAARSSPTTSVRGSLRCVCDYATMLLSACTPVILFSCEYYCDHVLL